MHSGWETRAPPHSHQILITRFQTLAAKPAFATRGPCETRTPEFSFPSSWQPSPCPVPKCQSPASLSLTPSPDPQQHPQNLMRGRTTLPGLGAILCIPLGAEHGVLHTVGALCVLVRRGCEIVDEEYRQRRRGAGSQPLPALEESMSPSPAPAQWGTRRPAGQVEAIAGNFSEGAGLRPFITISQGESY